MVRLLKLCATAALCVGGGSYTAGFQTITLNICKQIKKQNHPVQMETSVFPSLPALSPPSPLLSSVERRRRARVGARPYGLPRPRLSQPHTHSRARRHAQVRRTFETPQLRGRPDTRERLSSPGSRSESSHREPSNPRGLGASIFGHLSTLLVSKLPENWPTQGNEMHSHSWVTLPSRTILRMVTRDGP